MTVACRPRIERGNILIELRVRDEETFEANRGDDGDIKVIAGEG